MNNAPRTAFRIGQIVTISHFETVGVGDLVERKFLGTEEAQVIGIVARHGAPGMVNVRPANSEDIIAVHIRDMVAA